MAAGAILKKITFEPEHLESSINTLLFRLNQTTGNPSLTSLLRFNIILTHTSKMAAIRWSENISLFSVAPDIMHSYIILAK